LKSNSREWELTIEKIVNSIVGVLLLTERCFYSGVPP
jgi:hypothetical protein